MAEDKNTAKKVEYSSKDLEEVLNRIVRAKTNVSRRYIDEILEKIQDRNRAYFLIKSAAEMKAKELAETAGDLFKARHHEVMAETYRSIAERSFAE